MVAHADWSVDAEKQWLAVARRDVGGRFEVEAPVPAGDPATLVGRLREKAAGDALLLGLDLPLGVPRRWAERVGVAHFPDLLHEAGRGRWSRLFDVCGTREEIRPERPFYPASARKGASRAELAARLGLDSPADLARRCDAASPARPAACPVFWTLGPNQVGKAALAAWREIVGPAVASPAAARLWPFHGNLDDLLASGAVVFAETYPGEVYGHLEVGFRRPRGSKRRQADRAARAAILLAWAQDADIVLAPDLDAGITDGFGSAPSGEDAFDSLVGLFGMLNVILGRRGEGTPRDDPAVIGVEGWILGQAPDDAGIGAGAAASGR